MNEFGLTDAQIDDYIRCPKNIVRPPNPSHKLINRHYRNEVDWLGHGTEEKFQIFIRINAAFPENFSIGLSFQPIGTSGVYIKLLRFNGDHGGLHVNAEDHSSFTQGCHIHRATQYAFENNLRSENYATLTDSYTTYYDALCIFVEMAHILNTDQYPDFFTHQMKLL